MTRTLSILVAILYTLALAGCSSNSLSDSPASTTPASSAGPSSTPTETATPEEAPRQAASEPTEPPLRQAIPSAEGDAMPAVTIQVGNKLFTATLYDNESARAIAGEMPFTLEMDDFSSQEKVTALTFPLPSAATKTPATINAGDLYLWSGNNLVLFYTTFSNAYSYVPIGYIDDVAGLRDALGGGSVTVSFRVP